MKIEILGTGCSKCKQLMANAEKVLKDLGLQAEIVKVEDIAEIIGYGVMSTPALVIDGQVKAAGRLLSPEEIKKLIKTSV